ncbi:light-harvesting protein [Rhodopila sp.]|uniref:light-harvesting protein n=1 Tax=Rhodopila sp. TaxID=2480087 RepID=UPI003D0E9E1E
MNQGRIWCVVHPTVGLPLLLGSVALTSLAVHTAVMTHTTWMSNYWQGSAKPRLAIQNATPKVAATDSKAPAAFSMTVTPVPATAANAQASFVITVAPNVNATVDTKAAVDNIANNPSGTIPIRSASAN